MEGIDTKTKTREKYKIVVIWHKSGYSATPLNSTSCNLFFIANIL